MTLNQQSKAELTRLLDRTIAAPSAAEFFEDCQDALNFYQDNYPEDTDEFDWNTLWEEKMLFSFFSSAYYYRESGDDNWQKRAQYSLRLILGNDSIQAMVPDLEQAVMKLAIRHAARALGEDDEFSNVSFFIPQAWLDHWADLGQAIRADLDHFDADDALDVEDAFLIINNNLVDNADLGQLAEDNMLTKDDGFFSRQADAMIQPAVRFINQVRGTQNPAVRDLSKSYLEKFRQKAAHYPIFQQLDHSWLISQIK